MPEMKNSGVNWLHEIPDNWKTLKLLYCLREPICDGPHETPNYIDSGIPFISVDSLNDSKNINFDIVKKFISEQQYQTYMAKAKLEVGDILFSKAATIGKTAIVPDEKFMIWSPLAVIKNNSNVIDNNFLYYLLNCSELITAIRLSGSYNTQANVGMREMERAIIPVPPLEVQKSIANFLDQKCSEIDALSADIQSQIDVLEEYKKSIIAEAVTKGLNPDAEMKDSGIEWIGEIPAHWDVDKIKYHLKRNEPRNPGNVPVLSVYREYGVIPKDSRDDNHNITSEDTSKYKYIRPGDLVINKMKAWQGSLAVSEYEGIVSPAYFVYNFTDELFNKKYFHFLIRSCYKEEFRRISGGIREGQWDLPAEGFANELVLLPPIDEQNAIVEFINSKYTEIEEAIELKKAQLETLAEYKKSLIYEYVTGKKEVPVETNEIDLNAILLGAIANKLGEYQTGRIQLQKVLYLTNMHLGINPKVQYYRYGHGPYDINLNSCIDTLTKNKWFEEKTEKSTLLIKGVNVDEFLREYKEQIDSSNRKIVDLLNLLYRMNSLKRSKLERITTLYATWNDFLLDGVNPTDDQIVQEVMTNWTDNKSNTQYATWQDSLDKMKKNGLVPKGTGLHTISKL